jgi:hypothetical protein
VQSNQNLRFVQRFALIFLILAVPCVPMSAQEKSVSEKPSATPEKKRFALYATFLEATPVQLSDGAKWQMDKGDTFPVVMFKDQQTRIILQLAGTSFIVNADRVKWFEEKELTEAQLATYRANVHNYIESRAEKWKEQAKQGQPAPAK